MHMAYLRSIMIKSAGDEGDDYNIVRAGIAPGAAFAAAHGSRRLFGKKVVLPHANKPVPANDEALEGFQKEWDKLGITRGRHAIPHYHPASNSVNVLYDNLGVLAHETGHAKNFNNIKNMLGRTGSNIHQLLVHMAKPGMKYGTGAAAAAALLDADDDTVRNIGLAGSATLMPRLLEETAASVRGANLLRKINAPMKSRLGAFMGLPTYMLGAATPLTPWLGIKAYDAIKGE